MKWNQVVAVLLLSSVLCLLQLQTAVVVFACSCAPYSAEAQYDNADVVFSGRVLAMETQKVTRPKDGWTFSKNIYTFEVTQGWKGTPGSPVKVYYTSDFMTPEGLIVYSSCGPGPGFAVGSEYLVYASSEGEDPILLAHYGGCSGTRPIQYAQDDIAFLERTTGVDMPQIGESLQLTILILTAAGRCLAGGIAARRYLSQ